MSLFSDHVEKWKNGCGSCICAKAKQVVFARGTIPCDVLFIGEAPGASEDVIGQPFIGPAGKLLDQIIDQAMPLDEFRSNKHTTAFTNLVGCFPVDEKEAGVNEAPKEAIKACAPRLLEFIGICKPKLIVAVGALATKNIPTTGWMVSITHPAAILRANVAQRGLAIQKCVVMLSNAIAEL